MYNFDTNRKIVVTFILIRYENRIRKMLVW